MQSKSFLISFLGVFLVFATLLIHSVYQAFYQDTHRPRIISCLIYKAQPDQLFEQVEAESKFVDRFIILQPQYSNPVTQEIKARLKEKCLKPISYLSLQLAEKELEEDYKAIFSKIEKVHAFSPCQSRDIILIARQGYRVDYNDLYRSLDKISADNTNTYDLKAEISGEPSTIKVAAYGALRTSKHPFQQIWTGFRNSTVKRHFFFQTYPQKFMQVD